MSDVLAVDVGGSGLRLTTWSYAAGLGPTATAPGARVGSGGIDVAELVSSARSVVGDAEAPPVVVWSMRGLLFLSDGGAVLEAVSAGLGGGRTVVVSDAVAGLVGAVGGVRPAAVVSAGTGAVAFGTDFAEVWNRADGWGHVLGDRGGAAYLGLAGLRAALRAEDGFADGSREILTAATELLGPPNGWPRLVMTSADAPERLAAVAPLVTELAGSDPVAAAICGEAGAALADSLVVAARGLERPVLAATGGVLAATAVTDALDARLAELGVSRVPAQGNPLAGAVLLGRHLLDTGRLPTRAPYLIAR